MKLKHMVLLLTFIASITFFSFRPAEKAVETKATTTAAKAAFTILTADYNAGTYNVKFIYNNSTSSTQVSVGLHPYYYDCLWGGEVYQFGTDLFVHVEIWSNYGYLQISNTYLPWY